MCIYEHTAVSCDVYSHQGVYFCTIADVKDGLFVLKYILLVLNTQNT